MTTALKATNLTMAFGGIKAVSQLDFELEAGSITALIGPNGAGKTTVFNLLTGVYTPTEGQILLEGASITGLKPSRIAARGLARTFQNIRLFKGLSVLDNVRIGCEIRERRGVFGLLGSLARAPRALSEEARERDRALELLKLFELDARADDPAGSLPYGAQRRLEIARALATRARLLLLDEPAAGMNAAETAALMQTIVRVHREFALTILLIEHDMKLVMGISEKILVLDYGVKIAEGPPEKVRNDPKVIEAYLGKPRKEGDGA